jgi:hypothetical protein
MRMMYPSQACSRSLINSVLLPAASPKKSRFDEHSLTAIIYGMWEIEFTDEFEDWWNTLDPQEQESLAASVELLRQIGPQLSRPHADAVKGSKHDNMKELRTQHHGRPLRTLFAFDPRRCAILLIGGDKTGDDRFYARMIPLADQLYDQHLEQLRKEKLI